MARCSTCPSALHQGWQHPLGANLGPYTGQGHLPLPLCTTVQWGELGPPPHPTEPSGGELSVPPLLGAEPGGECETSPLQLGEGSLMRLLSSGA